MLVLCALPGGCSCCGLQGLVAVGFLPAQQLHHNTFNPMPRCKCDAAMPRSKQQGAWVNSSMWQQCMEHSLQLQGTTHVVLALCKACHGLEHRSAVGLASNDVCTAMQAAGGAAAQAPNSSATPQQKGGSHICATVTSSSGKQGLAYHDIVTDIIAPRLRGPLSKRRTYSLKLHHAAASASQEGTATVMVLPLTEIGVSCMQGTRHIVCLVAWFSPVQHTVLVQSSTQCIALLFSPRLKLGPSFV